MSPKISALYRRFSASIKETAFYLSTWMFWGKVLFFWKKMIFLVRCLDIFNPGQKFQRGSQNLFLPVYGKFLGQFFFLSRNSVFQHFPTLSERLLAIAKVNSAGLSKQHSAYELFQEKESFVKNAHYHFIVFFRTLLEKILAFLFVLLKILRKSFDFFEKNIGFFIMRPFLLQGKNIFIESIKCALYV